MKDSTSDFVAGGIVVAVFIVVFNAGSALGEYFAREKIYRECTEVGHTQIIKGKYFTCKEIKINEN